MRSRLVREAELVGVCRGKEKIQTLKDWKEGKEGWEIGRKKGNNGWKEIWVESVPQEKKGTLTSRFVGKGHVCSRPCNRKTNTNAREQSHKPVLQVFDKCESWTANNKTLTMSLLSLTCMNESHVHTVADTQTRSAEGSVADRGQLLSWREGAGGGTEGKRGEARDNLVVYREWRSN